MVPAAPCFPSGKAEPPTTLTFLQGGHMATHDLLLSPAGRAQGPQPTRLPHRGHEHPQPVLHPQGGHTTTHSLLLPPTGRAQPAIACTFPQEGHRAPNLHVPLRDSMSILSPCFPLRRTRPPQACTFSSGRTHSCPEPMTSLREDTWPPQPVFSPQGGHMATLSPYFPLREGTWFLPD